MTELRSILWDVDGTLAETERDGHRVAFNFAFEACGVPWRWDEAHYGRLLRVAGGFERLLYDMESRTDAPAGPEDRAALARAIHVRKNEFYAGLVSSGAIAFRGGVAAVIRQCRERGIAMGITTTTSRANVDALVSRLLGPGWREDFAVVVCGEDVRRKKPDPEVYRLAVQALGGDAAESLAIEDSPDGAAAACAAGVPVVVARSSYFADARIERAVAVGPGLHERRGWTPPPQAGSAEGSITLDDLQAWWFAGVQVSGAARPCEPGDDAPARNREASRVAPS